MILKIRMVNGRVVVLMVVQQHDKINNVWGVDPIFLIQIYLRRLSSVVNEVSRLVPKEETKVLDLL